MTSGLAPLAAWFFRHLPTQGEGVPPSLPSYGGEIARMLASLGVVLALVLALGWLLPRWLARTRTPQLGRHLELVETMRLDARRALYLVRVEGELVLIGAGEGGLVRLMGQNPGSPRFSERLHATTGAPAPMTPPEEPA